MTHLKAKIVVGAVAGTALAVGLSVAATSQTSVHRATATKTGIAASSSPTDIPLPQQGKSDAQIAQDYLQDSGFISGVTRVAVKRTTWGDFLPVSGLGALPPHDNATDTIDVVVQAGTVAPNGWGGHTSGFTYSYVISTVDISNLEGMQDVLTVPGSAWPSWLAALPGTETDATPANP